MKIKTALEFGLTWKYPYQVDFDSLGKLLNQADLEPKHLHFGARVALLAEGWGNVAGYLLLSRRSLLKKYLVTGRNGRLPFLRPKLEEIEYKNPMGRKLVEMRIYPVVLDKKFIYL